MTIHPIVYAYSPRKDDDHRGEGYASAAKGLDGKYLVRTLENVRKGESSFVTLASHVQQAGKTFVIKEITYVNSKDETHTLKNVTAYTHDTNGSLGSKVMANGERVDVAVDHDLSVRQVSRQPFFLKEFELSEKVSETKPIAETPKPIVSEPDEIDREFEIDPKPREIVSETPKTPPKPVETEENDLPDFSNDEKDRYNTSIPASIRHNNPGATYPASWMNNYGMKGFSTIGGGHKIAYFPDAISGAAANIDLLHRLYADRTVNSLIAKWSGGNSSAAYASHVAKALGISTSDTITKAMIQTDGWKLIRAQAQWESGRKGFPLTDDQWLRAQALFREKNDLPSKKEEPKKEEAKKGELPWIVTARQLIGIEEDTSKESNEAIMEWANFVGVDDVYTNDDIPWCGLFEGYLMKANGIEPPSSMLWALSWNNWGIKLSEPAFGCVIVFKRDGGGHVGNYLGENDTHYYVLGGNQSNAVNIRAMEKNRVVGFRWPKGYEHLLVKGRVFTSLKAAVSENEV